MVLSVPPASVLIRATSFSRPPPGSCPDHRSDESRCDRRSTNLDLLRRSPAALRAPQFDAQEQSFLSWFDNRPSPSNVFRYGTMKIMAWSRVQPDPCTIWSENATKATSTKP